MTEINQLVENMLNHRKEEIDEKKLDFLQRHGLLKGWMRNEPTNAEGKAYLQRFKEALKAQPEERTGYHENDLKRAIAKHAINRANKLGYEWTWDEATKARCNMLLHYFANDPRCNYSLEKGLCFYGSTGVGKTELFKVFQKFIISTIPESEKRFKMVSCRQVYEDYARGQGAAIERYSIGNWCFDDLGSEPNNYKHFGNDINVMEQVLFYREKERENGYLNTLITSNLNTSEILERYGDRVYDRIRKMVTFIEIKGESKRI